LALYSSDDHQARQIRCFDGENTFDSYAKKKKKKKKISEKLLEVIAAYGSEGSLEHMRGAVPQMG